MLGNNLLSQGEETLNLLPNTLFLSKISLGRVIWVSVDIRFNKKFPVSYSKSYDVPLVYAV